MRQLELKDLVYELQPQDPWGRPAGDLFDSWKAVSPQAAADLKAAVDLLGRVKPSEETPDRVYPAIWLEVPREEWQEARERFEDGERNETELKEDWQAEFPHEVEWLAVTLTRRTDRWLLHHTPIEACFCLDPEKDRVAGFYPAEDAEQTRKLETYLTWLGSAVKARLEWFVRNPEEYHDRMEAGIPDRERVGKVLRSDLWRLVPGDDHFVRDEVTPKERARFVKLAPSLEKAERLAGLTLNDYLRFCSICYEAAGYSDLDGLSPREQYLQRADGRHDGLLDLPPDSPEALAKWLRGGYAGGHPWEIARGGNRTHISLYLVPEGEECYLSLAGSSRGRAAETIKMALALSAHGVPFELRDWDHLARMAEGSDWVGVVPTRYLGAGAYSFFPEEPEVRDLIAYSEVEEFPQLAAAVRWRPADRLALR